MERNIPHVLDIFAHSPGAKRRARERREEQAFSSKLKEQQKNPGSDSAVSLGSSDDDENERNISKYFDYLEHDTNLITKDESSAPRKDAKTVLKTDSKAQKLSPNQGNNLEKEIRHIERHLSMKKTIRKKMMRDLQQAFVENPGELKQDPEKIAPDKKSNINIANLTISKKRLSKSEHSFLDMLKDEENQDKKERKLRDLEAYKDFKDAKRFPKHRHEDEDSGNDSPTRESKYKSKKESSSAFATRPQNKHSEREEKKPSFWKRLTGKGKVKR